MFYALLALLVGAAILVVGYNIGRNRFSQESKAARVSLRDNVSLNKQNEAYRSALESIAAGRGGLPEITASAALAEARNYQIKEIE